MEFPTVYQLDQSISIFRVLHFYSNFNRPFCEQTVEILIAVSDLCLHGLPMSHKKDPRLIWVKRVTSGESDKPANHGSLSKAIPYPSLVTQV